MSTTSNESSKGKKKCKKILWEFHDESLKEYKLDNLQDKKKIICKVSFKVEQYFIDVEKKIIWQHSVNNRNFGLYMRFYCINTKNNNDRKCRKLYILNYFINGLLTVFEDSNTSCDCKFTCDDLLIYQKKISNYLIN